MNDHGRSLKKFTILSLITKIPFKKPCQVKDILSITVKIYNQYLYEFTNSTFTTRAKLLVTIKDRNAKIAGIGPHHLSHLVEAVL